MLEEGLEGLSVGRLEYPRCRLVRKDETDLKAFQNSVAHRVAKPKLTFSDLLFGLAQAKLASKVVRRA